MTKAAKVWTVKDIKRLMEINVIFLERCILKIYSHQTRDEQQIQETNHTNGIGFNGVDAPFMSSLAEWIKKSNREEGFRLTPLQRERARKIMPKYAGQIVKHFCNQPKGE